MKKIQLLLMLIISGSAYSAGKINFNEQKKIEEVKKIEKQEKIQVNSVSQNNLGKEKEIRNTIISFAKTQIGKPYLWGASGNQKFDCSSFTQYVYANAGINIPRVSYDQAQFKPKLVSGIKPGDLLFFETLGKGRISHVGIYIGNRKFIHASSKYKGVVISEFSGFYANTFRWAVSAL